MAALERSVQPPERMAVVIDALRQLAHIATSLRRQRLLAGALLLEKPEKVFTGTYRTVAAPDVGTVDLAFQRPNLAASMIEELMSLANTHCAGHLQRFVQEIAVRNLMRPTPADTHLHGNASGAHLLPPAAESQRTQEEWQRLSSFAALFRHQAYRSAEYTTHRWLLARCMEILFGITESAGADDRAFLRLCMRYVDSLRDDDPRKEALVHTLARCTRGGGYMVFGPLDFIKENSSDLEDRLEHFSLNVPVYCQFTSPIRRYTDVLVHRCVHAMLHSPQYPTGAHPTHASMRRALFQYDRMSSARRQMQQEVTELFVHEYLRQLLVRAPQALFTACVLDFDYRTIRVFVPLFGFERVMPWSRVFASAQMRYPTWMHITHEPVAQQPGVTVTDAVPRKLLLCAWGRPANAPPGTTSVAMVLRRMSFLPVRLRPPTAPLSWLTSGSSLQWSAGGPSSSTSSQSRAVDIEFVLNLV